MMDDEGKKKLLLNRLPFLKLKEEELDELINTCGSGLLSPSDLDREINTFKSFISQSFFLPGVSESKNEIAKQIQKWKSNRMQQLAQLKLVLSEATPSVNDHENLQILLFQIKHPNITILNELYLNEMDHFQKKKKKKKKTFSIHWPFLAL